MKGNWGECLDGYNKDIVNDCWAPIQVVSLLSFLFPITASSVFIAPAGTDDATCGRAADPCETLTRAMSNVDIATELLRLEGASAAEGDVLTISKTSEVHAQKNGENYVSAMCIPPTAPQQRVE